MEFETLATLFNDGELKNLFLGITGNNLEDTLTRVSTMSVEDAPRLGDGMTLPPDSEVLTPPPGKIDGVHGGFVNDGMSCYWVSGPGRYVNGDWVLQDGLLARRFY